MTFSVITRTPFETDEAYKSTTDRGIVSEKNEIRTGEVVVGTKHPNQLRNILLSY